MKRAIPTAATSDRVVMSWLGQTQRRGHSATQGPER